MADKKSLSVPPTGGTSLGAAVAPPAGQSNFVDAGPSTSLMNKPGEPTFKLGINTNKIEFKCTEDRKPSSVFVKLFNPTNETVSFKIRCTSADIFRVQPPLGFVKANETVSVVIWYQNQDKKDAMSKCHYFAFYHTRSDGRTARELWANSKVEGGQPLIDPTGAAVQVSQAQAQQAHMLQAQMIQHHHMAQMQAQQHAVMQAQMQQAALQQAQAAIMQNNILNAQGLLPQFPSMAPMGSMNPMASMLPLRGAPNMMGLMQQQQQVTPPTPTMMTLTPHTPITPITPINPLTPLTPIGAATGPMFTMPNLMIQNTFVPTSVAPVPIAPIVPQAERPLLRQQMEATRAPAPPSPHPEEDFLGI